MQDEQIRTLVPVRIRVEILHYRNGKLIERYKGGDIVGSVGRDWLCAKTAGTPTLARGTYIRYSAIGTGQAAPASGQTALGGPIYRGTVTYTKDSATGSASLDRTFSIGSTYAMRESGLFVQKAGGTMYCRGTYPVKNVSSGDQITVRYTQGFST